MEDMHLGEKFEWNVESYVKCQKSKSEGKKKNSDGRPVVKEN